MADFCGVVDGKPAETTHGIPASPERDGKPEMWWRTPLSAQVPA